LFLKSLEVFGFKSFATKTRFEFKPGVTAIVGPNGCGKSNVVDALRWVLGEASARSLRGEVMDDVIFSGSDDRKPFGMAEVSVTIANDDELLPVEYSEVNITRRLYRSGESEFFLNKSAVRLRDIHELFADTGIGKTAYSIMEQGNIDMILSNRPEERMAVFEEAAGITRYKMRMKQSYRKLASTEENLLRLNLIMSEVEKEYNSLRKQAEKAAVFKKLKRREQELETLFNYMRLSALRAQGEKNDRQIVQLKEKKSALEDQLGGLNEVVRNGIERVRSIEKEISEVRNRLYKTDAALDSVSSRSQHIRDRINEIKSEIAKKMQLQERIRGQRSELEARVEQLRRDGEAIRGILSSQEDKCSRYRNEVEFINGVLDRSMNMLQRSGAELEEVGRTMLSLRQALKEVTDRLLKEIDSIKAKFKGDEKRKNELMERMNRRIHQIDASLRRHKTRLNDLRFGVKGPDVDSLSEEIEQLRVVFGELDTDIQAVIKIQDDLSQMLFGKESVHSRKEQIESSIEQTLKNEAELKKQIDELNEEVRTNNEKKEEFSSLINELLPDMARNREKQKHLEENVRRLNEELERSDESLQDVQFEVHSLNGRG
jgi:chromosome segregation protein